MKQREAVEGGWQFRQMNVVVSCLDTYGVAAPAPVQAQHFQSISDDRMTGIPVFDVKEIDAVAENTRFVIILYAQALFRVEVSEPFLQIFKNIVAHPCLRPVPAGFPLERTFAGKL
jgi:hypothetical protein